MCSLGFCALQHHQGLCLTVLFTYLESSAGVEYTGGHERLCLLHTGVHVYMMDTHSVHAKPMWSGVRPACSAGEAHTVMDDGMQSYECQQHNEAHCSMPANGSFNNGVKKRKETMYANS